jgi:hypothetical protein
MVRATTVGLMAPGGGAPALAFGSPDLLIQSEPLHW